MLVSDRRKFALASGFGLAAAAMMIKPAAAAGGDLYVIAELVAKPEQAGALRTLLTEFVAGARHEPGCKHYSLLEDNGRPGRFLTFETWTNSDALDAHMKTPAIKGAGVALATMLAAPFTQIKMSMVSDG